MALIKLPDHALDQNDISKHLKPIHVKLCLGQLVDSSKGLGDYLVL